MHTQLHLEADKAYFSGWCPFPLIAASSNPYFLPSLLLRQTSYRPTTVSTRMDKNLHVLTQKVQNNAEIKVHRVTPFSFNLVSV